MAALMFTGCWLLGSNGEEEEDGKGSGKKQNNAANASGIYDDEGNLIPDTGTLANSFLWLTENAEAEAVYTIKLSEDEPVSQQLTLDSAHLHEMSGVTVKLESLDPEKPVEIALSEKGLLFHVEGDVSLVIGNGVTLKGLEENTDSLILVENGGTLELEEGAKITGFNSIESRYAISVLSNSSFNMKGGEISGGSSTYTNSSEYTSGGAVLVNGEGARFTMSAGKITENNAIFYGGGVCVSNKAVFIMDGGEISGNTCWADDIYYEGVGGGVLVMGVGEDAQFIMNGGVISGNSSERGGGVCIAGRGEFTLNDGTIGKNSAVYGAGVCVVGTPPQSLSFWGINQTINIPTYGKFIKEGGIIYGEDAGDDSNIIIDSNKVPTTGQNRGASLSVGHEGRKFKSNTTMTAENKDRWEDN